jgi:hypothetical protein
MATRQEVEALRDKYIDVAGDILKDIVDNLDGDEPVAIIEAATGCAENAKACLLDMIRCLDDLLVQKKRAE